MLHLYRLRVLVSILAIGTVLGATAATPAELRDEYAAKAGSPPSAERGQKFFLQKFGKDYENCAECHGAVPVRRGKDLVSGKTLEPLAPAANPARLTDRGRVDYMFRQNCKDVVGRECTAQEKADVLTWLIGLKP